jgi:hypothetical protein
MSQITTSTQAPPPPPTKTPLPNPAPPATCNQGRPLPDYAENTTFNRDAAKSAITTFCHDNPYSWAKNAAQTCPSWQSYAYEGPTINSGGQSGVLGPANRIYLAMRWDLVDCPNNDWWAVNNEQDSPAGKYLDGPTLYDDCVAGFNAALGGCKFSLVPVHGYLLTILKAKHQAILMVQKTHINAWSTFCFLQVHPTCNCLATIFRGNIRKPARQK